MWSRTSSRPHGPAARPCLVGHDPDFSSLLGELVGTAVVPMRKGALARVDFEGGVRAGRGVLRFSSRRSCSAAGSRRPGAEPSARISPLVQRQRIVCVRGVPGSTTSGPLLAASGGPDWGSTQIASSGSV